MFKTTTENFNGFLSRRFRPAWIFAVLLACSAGLVGCAMFQRVTLEDSQERLQALEVERDLLKQQIDNRDRDVARLQLESLAQDARIQKLDATLQRREQELGQAQERLQRLETRIQGLTGPAQAAAAIAEAEAAYQVAAAQGKIALAQGPAKEIFHLLENATAAYETADFVVAADLADQVIRRLSETGTPHQPEGMSSMKLPERRLANPVAFLVRVKSHLRRGPGMRYASVAIMPAKTEVTGLATRGQWIKVIGPRGVHGWIYGKLLAAPD